MAVRTNKTEKFTSFGTILEVRDAVLLEDGRFILSTVGVRRFKVLNRSEQVRICTILQLTDLCLKS